MTSRATPFLCCAAMACLSLASIALAGPTTAPDVTGDPYLLDTCPVSGQKLGSMGDPVVKTIDGREVRFCCGGCVGRFEANTAKYFTAIDKAIATQQMPFYPLKTCVVSGESLIVKGKDISVNYVYRNRLVRLCCKGCIRELNAEPAGFLKNLDAAVIKAQSADYPLQHCVVLEGSKLGSRGDPVEIVVANRLVKFCCPRCRPKFEQDPAAYLVRLDKAWKPIHAAHGDHDGPGHGKDHDGPGHGHDGHDHDGG